MNFKREFPRKNDRKKDGESRQKLLEPAEFCELLLSRRQLLRFQDVDGMLGLFDPLTDERYQVDQARLDRYAERLVAL
jgi:hypothetical protein